MILKLVALTSSVLTCYIQGTHAFPQLVPRSSRISTQFDLNFQNQHLKEYHHERLTRNHSLRRNLFTTDKALLLLRKMNLSNDPMIPSSSSEDSNLSQNTVLSKNMNVDDDDNKIENSDLHMKMARELKQRAVKERLEAERLTTELILNKISALEKNIESSRRRRQSRTLDQQDRNLDQKEQKEDEWRQSIDLLQKQLKSSNSTSTASGDSYSSSLLSSQESDSTTSPSTKSYSYMMPEDILQRRMDAYSRFSYPVKSLYARATGVDDINQVESILRKAYDMEKTRFFQNGTALSFPTAYSDRSSYNEQDLLLIIANAQAGYETLPTPVQKMVAESVGMDASTCTNATQIVEQLIENNKLTPSEDGGVEFCINDDDDDENKSRGKDREWTEEERQSAQSIYEGLPEPMKVMLAKSIQENSTTSNSTIIVQKLMEQKKMLPTDDGVEFLVFGNDDEIDRFESGIVGDSYIRALLPKATRKEGQTPNLDDVNILYTKVLGKRTFNPTEKPEQIPGGYVIRGESQMDDGDMLIEKIEKQLSKTTAAGKFNVFYIRDPTMITQEQFDDESYELPLIMVLGTDLSPDTNRLVKPIISILGGLSISAISVATCLSTDPNMEISVLEELTGSLTMGLLATLLSHEAAHQFVAWKDKFHAGFPTIIPSFQLGLEGCITPITSPPKNLKSLFDFALAGPLVGMCVSVLLLYSGLEKQVFLDAAAQANLPSLPVNLIRSSSLVGGIIEWLLGEGTLYSADPYALIRLHPYAIAGFIGIVTNAFSLLPIGNTDGGRIALSIFGRSFLRFARSLTLGLLILAGLFGSDQANLLIVYAIVAQIWMSEPEIPCKNEVDGIDDIRLFIGVSVAVLVGLAVIPLPS